MVQPLDIVCGLLHILQDFWGVFLVELQLLKFDVSETE